MSIMIREYLGYSKGERSGASIRESAAFSNQSADPIAPNSLMVDIEGIHVGPTRNFTRYMESALTSSVTSWTKPYQKPLIMHHNEKDGKIIGRVKNVYYTDVNTRSGTGALVFTANVPDKDGAEQVEDGRLMTVSIGVLAHDVKCSICGHNIAEEGECEHERGSIYDGEVCYWDIYEMEGKELSYVIVPSDAYAKNIKIYRGASNTALKESNEEKGVSSLKLTESEKKIAKVKESLEAKIEEKEETTSEEIKEENTGEAKGEINLGEKTEEEKEEGATAEMLKAELEEIAKKLKEAEEKIDLISQESEAIKKESEKVKTELSTKEKELSEERELRESLEAQAVEKEKEIRITLTENLNLMRKLSGRKELETEKIQERSMESIKDAILDLKEEMGSMSKTKSITKVEDPTITESKTEIVKKEKRNSNIDLEEGLQDLFNSITGKFSKQ